MAIPDRNRVQNIGNGLDNIHHMPETPFLGGLKQRLLSFILRGIWNEEHDPTSVSILNFFKFQTCYFLLNKALEFLY